MNLLSLRKTLLTATGGIVALALSLSSLSASAQKLTTLKVGVSPVPHAEIMEFIKPMLKAEGIDLKIVEFSDYVLPNKALDSKELDANFFQHKPYLLSFNQSYKTDLVEAPNGTVHVEPFGAYSKKIKAIGDLQSGATVALPNDPTNGARALLLLHNNGIIKLKDPKNLLATSSDVSENPKKLKFIEMDAAQLSRVVAEVDLALINTNFAMQGGLNPLKDALIIENKDSPYANIIAVRKDNANSPEITKLMKVLRSDKVKAFILKEYKGAIVPVF